MKKNKHRFIIDVYCQIDVDDIIDILQAFYPYCDDDCKEFIDNLEYIYDE